MATEALQGEYSQLKFDHHLVDSVSILIVVNLRKLNAVLPIENLIGDMYVFDVNAV